METWRARASQGRVVPPIARGKRAQDGNNIQYATEMMTRPLHSFIHSFLNH